MPHEYPENVYGSVPRERRKTDEVYLREAKEISRSISQLADAMHKSAETNAELITNRFDKIIAQFNELNEKRAVRGEIVATLGQKVTTLETSDRDQWSRINEVVESMNEGKGIKIVLSTAIPAVVSIAIAVLSRFIK